MRLFLNPYASYEMVPIPDPLPGTGGGEIGLPVIVTVPVPDDKMFVQIPVPIALASSVRLAPFAPTPWSCESMLLLISDATTAIEPTVTTPAPK